MTASLTVVSYIGATILFILSLGGLANPETARRGIVFGMIGMAIAVLATVLGPRVTPGGYAWIIGALVVGALLAVGVALAANDNGPLWARALGFVALVFASVNIFGGFLVTQRMLAMYQKKKK